MSKAPWLTGTALLLLLALFLAPLAVRFGPRYWAFYAGAGALLLLFAGWLERLWRGRPLPRARPRRLGRGRLRVVKGGRGGNGRAGEPGDEGTDEPRWLM
jgi:hypothetical protein